MDLATRIRTARRKSGLSQKAIAEQLGVSRGAVANWEDTGNGRPSRTNLGRIAIITGVAIDWLARGHGPMQAMPLPLVDQASPPVTVDTIETHLLTVFRLASEDDRLLIMEIVDSIANLLG